MPNHAEGDTAQISNFAQAWNKCWLWRVNYYGKKSGSILINLFDQGGPPEKMAQLSLIK